MINSILFSVVWKNNIELKKSYHWYNIKIKLKYIIYTMLRLFELIYIDNMYIKEIK